MRVAVSLHTRRHGVMLKKEQTAREALWPNIFDIFLEQVKGLLAFSYRRYEANRHKTHPEGRGELSYLAPLGSENISAPYFKQCFFRGGGITPQTVKHHASQSQHRNNKYFILHIEFCINNKI